MKKLLCAMLALALLLSASAFAENTLYRACPLFDVTAFEKYGAFSLNEETGDWSVYDNTTAAALRAIGLGVLSGSADGMFFYLAAEGNLFENSLLPVLNIVRTGGDAENACAASLFADDVRYDMEVTCEAFSFGRYRGEIMRALLTADDFAMLDALIGAKDVRVFLHGNDGATATIKAEKAPTSARDRLQAASMDCLSLKDELLAMGFADYAMSPRDKIRWKEAYGFLPRIEKTDIAVETVPEGKDIPALPNATHILSARSGGAAIKLLQAKLVEMGYQFTPTSSAYTASVRAAVKDLQNLYGFLPTGSVDGALLRAMYGEQPPAAPAEEAPDAGEYLPLSDCSLALSRWWLAKRISPAKPESALSALACANSDNLLLIADGGIVSNAAESLSLGWDVKAEFVYNGSTSFEAFIRIERDGGTWFDNALGALAEGRVVFAAEIPARIAGNGAWELVVKRNSEALRYSMG
ncbi:MAG: peptidoglycan-binding domain-containing protein [Christensenellales bacterium]|jgi:hypothetical protein